MKIKHWQGYGSVNVKKLAEYDTNRFTGEKKIIIEVTGMHECGLSRKDPYDIYNWLFKRGERFAPDCKDSRNITKIEIFESVSEDKTDKSVYEITYRKD